MAESFIIIGRLVKGNLTLRELVLLILLVLNFPLLIIVERRFRIELLWSAEMSHTSSSTLLHDYDIWWRRSISLLERPWILDSKRSLRLHMLGLLLHMLLLNLRLNHCDLFQIKLGLFLLGLLRDMLSNRIRSLKELLDLHVQRLEEQVG